MHAPQLRTPHPVTVLVVGLPIVFLILNLLVIPGYTGDDAYIHFTYIRNILDRGVYSYNTAQPTYGSTSVLWVLAGSAWSFVFKNIPLAMRALSGLCLIAACILLDRYVRERFSPRPAVRLSALAMFLGNAVLFRWALTGMETTAVLLVSILFLLTWDPQRPLRTAGVSVFAYLVRPEFLLLPVAHVIVARWQRNQTIRDLVIFAAATCVFFSAWFLAASLYFGAIVPLTFVKSGSWLDSLMALRFVKVFLGTFPDLIALILVMVVLSKPPGDLLRRFVGGEVVALVFSLLVLIFYVISGTGVISRYLLIVDVPLVLGALRLLVGTSRERWLPSAASAVVLVEALLFLWIHYGAINSFVSGFQETYARIGLLAERKGENDTSSVMISDVGIVGYYSRRPVIDLGGLTSTQIRLAGTNNQAVLVRMFRPRYIVARLDTPVVGEYIGRIEKEAGGTIDSVSVLYSDRIGRLGVLSPEEKRWDVYLLKVKYAGIPGSVGDRDGPGLFR